MSGQAVTVTLRVRREVVELAEDMVRLGVARSRNHAFNIILELGLRGARELVERRRRARALVERFREEGLPIERLPRAEDVEEERRRG